MKTEEEICDNCGELCSVCQAVCYLCSTEEKKNPSTNRKLKSTKLVDKPTNPDVGTEMPSRQRSESSQQIATSGVIGRMRRKVKGVWNSDKDKFYVVGKKPKGKPKIPRRM